jgi:hypothetical protein
MQQILSLFSKNRARCERIHVLGRTRMNSHRTDICLDQPKWMIAGGKYTRHGGRLVGGGEWNKGSPSNSFWVVGVLGVCWKDTRKDFDELDGELVS